LVRPRAQSVTAAAAVSAAAAAARADTKGIMDVKGVELAIVVVEAGSIAIVASESLRCEVVRVCRSEVQVFVSAAAVIPTSSTVDAASARSPLLLLLLSLQRRR
jgi:hypothetical protein